MTDAIEFVRDGHKLRLVVSKVLDPRYWVVNEVRLANPEDLRTAGYVPASEANAIDAASYRAACTMLRCEPQGAVTAIHKIQSERDTALQRVRELESSLAEAHPVIVDLQNERDDLRQKLEQAERVLQERDIAAKWSDYPGLLLKKDTALIELQKKLTAAEQRANAEAKRATKAENHLSTVATYLRVTDHLDVGAMLAAISAIRGQANCASHPFEAPSVTETKPTLMDSAHRELRALEDMTHEFQRQFNARFLEIIQGFRK